MSNGHGLLVAMIGLVMVVSIGSLVDRQLGRSQLRLAAGRSVRPLRLLMTVVTNAPSAPIRRTRVSRVLFTYCGPLSRVYKLRSCRQWENDNRWLRVQINEVVALG
nr:hypothetical protein [Mycobacterium lepromatosis]